MVGPGEIACADGFLSPRQRAVLLQELEFTLWRPSLVVSRSGGALSSRQSFWRASESATEDWFGPALLSELRAVEGRIEQAFGIPATHFEPWQATRYGPGDDYAYHQDAGRWADAPEGERRWTALIYLETPEEGGATDFRELGRTIDPLAGRLAVWDNLAGTGAPDPRMVHAALPVRRGRKTVLVSWAHERALATRSAIPSAPEKERTAHGVG
jgi:hypothetical protein